MEGWGTFKVNCLAFFLVERHLPFATLLINEVNVTLEHLCILKGVQGLVGVKVNFA